MTVAAERIERNFRRRSSFIHEQRRERHETLAPLEEVIVDVVDGKPNPRSPRYKSVSVCLPLISLTPADRTDNVFDMTRPTVHRCEGSSRFVVEPSCHPDLLDPMDLQSISSRLRGLSGSEVFHEPPQMYVYRERPAPVVYTNRKPTDIDACTAFIKKRKHTLCAWTFGIVALSLITTVIVLQATGVLG
ncbi:unnamed protein product [Haemonchus placei]|uniref:Membrane protein US8A n=1 Tax=Haemonchus placei TaxID=6290 RepID=A0A0N4WVW0_HAEPC|nr:unnamed protein product [Haemonchus placei]